MKNKTTKNILLLSIGILLLLSIIVFASVTILNSKKTINTTTKTVSTSSQSPAGTSTGEVQNVKLKMVEGWKYVLEPSVLKKDVPVRMEVDLTTVKGCMKDVVIREFNVRKLVSPGDNIINFVPTKTGTFYIACSMNMGQGTFTVVN